MEISPSWFSSQFYNLQDHSIWGETYFPSKLLAFESRADGKCESQLLSFVLLITERSHMILLMWNSVPPPTLYTLKTSSLPPK